MAKRIDPAVTLITFGIFMTEALLHYNLGAHKDVKEKRTFVFPPAKDFLKLALIVGAFSVLNGVIIARISKSSKLKIKENVRVSTS